MPSFSVTSSRRLANAHPLIQKVMNEAIRHYDFMMLDSQRGRAAQEKAFREGHSKAHFGQSAHNWSPSIAVDVAPYPLDWNDRKRFIDLSKIILPIAKDMGVPLRWGGDWNMNGIMTDEHLSDLPHYELHPWRTWAKQCKPFGG
jgi:peptidoglycan L-alanyl-D-glutamate endopeptidase CwlK